MVAVPVASPDSAYIDQAARLADQHRVTIPLADQPLVFLNTVWQSIPADHLVGLVADTTYFKDGQWHATTTSKWCWRDQVGGADAPGAADLIEWAKAANNAPYAMPGRGGIYWLTASRKHSVLNRFAARGSLDELLVVTSLYADLDCEKRGYTLDTALKVLLSMPLPPTIVTFSGGGLQAVHVLSQPWSVINREAAAEFKAYNLALYKSVFEKTDLILDTSVHNADRMLRLTGFINRKPERHGAVARIVYFNPAALYTPDQIRANVTLPMRHTSLMRLFAPVTPNPDGTYQVGQEFVHYLVDKQPPPPERHPVILRLAMQAARAGMPAPDFMARMRPVAQDWYKTEPHRAEGEFNSIITWAYGQADEDDEPTGAWLVRLTPDGFAEASEDEHDALRDKTLPTDAPPAPVAQTRTIQEVRVEQVKRIRDYVHARIKGLATYMLVRTPPGAGKTHAALTIGYEFALQQKATGRGKVAILSQFTLDEAGGWQEWLRSFGITDTRAAQYLVGRNASVHSAGYCSQAAIADGVAAKGYNAVALVCKRCQHQTACEIKGYLSQFKRAERSRMLLTRHQHGVIDALMGYRRLLIFDESPLAIVGACTKVPAKELVLTAPVGMQSLYPELVNKLNKLMEALRMIVSGNEPLQNRYPTRDHVKLGGRWLFDRLIMALGPDLLAEILRLDVRPVQQAGQPGPFNLTVEGVAGLPQNFVFDLWSILKYEYENHFLANRAHWNSRLIVWGQELRIYPMRPLAYDPLTKIIITDATGQPELYAKAFYDTKTGKPREAYIYEAPLAPHAQITQWTNSGNSRNTFRRRGKTAEIEDTDGQPLTLEADNTALARAKTQIKLLAERHNKSLLVVCYQSIHEKLRKWSGDTGVLDPEYIQYYGNLRGRNDYKHLEAVLLIGEPRIPPMEVFAQAQVWYWDDELPVDFELDTTGLKLEPYPGYVDAEGKGRAYAYPGYRDERLNRMYVWAIQAEMRQCYERIRCNAPEIDPATGKPQAKYVYIAAQMPCSDHVDELLHWSQWETDQAGRVWCMEQFKSGRRVIPQAEYIEAVQAYETNYQRAKDSYDRVYAVLEADGLLEPKPMVEKTRLQIVIDWLLEDPARQQLSIREVSEQTGIARMTVQRAFKVIG